MDLVLFTFYRKRMVLFEHSNTQTYILNYQRLLEGE